MGTLSYKNQRKILYKPKSSYVRTKFTFNTQINKSCINPGKYWNQRPDFVILLKNKRRISNGSKYLRYSKPN